MIIPVKTTFENFLSFKDKQEFVYQQEGIHYIYGIDYDSITSSEWSRESYNVGVGKSTLAMVAQYALYGKVQKKINKDKIINKEAGRDLFVSFEFIVNDKAYKIERYRRHKIHRSNVYLFEWRNEDWLNISSIDNEATQEEIGKLIGIDINTFEKAALLTRDDKNQFLELPTLNRGYIFENLSQLQKLKTYYDKAKKKIKPIEDDLTNINNRIIELITIIKRDGKYIRDLKQEYAENKESLDAEIKDLEEKIKSVLNIGLSVSDIIKIIEEHKQIQLELDACNKEIESIDSMKQSILNLKNSSQESLDIINNDLNKTQKRFKSHKPTTCHNCGAIQNEDDYNKEHDRIAKVIDDLKKRETKELKIFKKYEKEFTDISSRLYELMYVDTQKLIQRKAALHNIEEEHMNDIGQLQEQFDKKNQELANLQKPNIDKLKDEILFYNKELEEKKSQKELLLQEKSMVEFWINALDFKNESSIKQYIISKLIPVFNNLLQQNLEIVYNGAMMVTFDNMFNETIIYNGQSYEYDELSTGEKTKLNFCINFSIFDLTRINFEGCKTLFIDELFVHVDPATIQTFISMIKNKYSANSAIYIISHSEIVKDLCEPQTTIRIEKRNNNSTICYE